VFVARAIPATVRDRLAGACDLDVHDGPQDLPRQALLGRVAEAEGLVSVLTTRVDPELLDAAPRLRIVANIAVGYDNIDLAAAAARGVVVTNTPDVLTESVADFTFGLIFAVTRRIVEGDRLVRAGGWRGWALDFMLGTELRGKRLGVVGMGRIGRAVAARGAVFGLETVYAEASEANEADEAGRGAGPPGARRLPIDEVFATADIVSVHVPLTAGTRHLVDARRLALMKPTAYFVNTARGPVVDEAALVEVLRARGIAGAALDVYEREPLVHPGLPGLDNVVLVPHLGSATIETRTAMADLAARNVLAVLAGQPPVTPVGPALPARETTDAGR
jgi:glyoxylate reductase